MGTPEEPPAIAPVAEASAQAWQAWEVAALVGLAALALLLRLNGYAHTPLFTDNADEVQFTWAGLNLILHGDPYTWAYFGYASHETLAANGTTYPMVHHWMDHPPLFSLIMGGWVWLLGVRDMVAVAPEQVRILSICFSALTVVLSYLLGRRLIDRRAAMCGAALLATAPAAVLMGREVEPESLQAVLLLLALLCTLRILETGPGRWTVSVLLVVAVAAPLMKVTGVALAGICAVILAVYGRWRLAGALLAAGVAGFALFVVYGWLIDWPQFVRIWSLETGNRVGAMSGFDFVTAAVGINRRLRDGWWVLGWIGLGLLLGRGARRRELFLVWPAAAYLAVMLLMAGERQMEQYGWYRLIIYPQLYLAAGWLAWEAVSRHSISLLTLLLALGGATATNWWLGGPDATWIPNPLLLAAIAAPVVGPALLATWRRREMIFKQVAWTAAALALALIVLGNTIESLWLDRIFGRM